MRAPRPALLTADNTHESCQVAFAQPVLLQVHLFDTESCCDKLTVDSSTGGTVYSGTDGPDGVEASALSWSSDGSVVGVGFKVCFTLILPPAPPVSASTVGEFTAAVADSSINKILLAAGTYEFTSDMCTGSAVCINRALTIEAEVPGTVVLNAMGERQVFEIQSSGTAELIGLNITGGKSDRVQAF